MASDAEQEQIVATARWLAPYLDVVRDGEEDLRQGRASNGAHLHENRGFLSTLLDLFVPVESQERTPLLFGQRGFEEDARQLQGDFDRAIRSLNL